ncbi:hypothetical protein AMATHDRAFT_158744 [Amanita thiersii Skay4041]|uniref:Hydrophobin n=1 Tax=Amanita thiersii Skay4041 TaxID=703135 RepID=A0A2A9NCW0_9AGAR|nr:hypothetical protein AMATHDRAFT_158744 [Amanita thiersii Skay4041]
MRISSIVLFALPILAVADPVRRGGGQCNSGSVQCCETTQSPKDAGPTTIEQLKAVGVDVNSLTGLIGLNCSPISVGSDTCSSQTVCCTNNYYDGLINVGCTTIIIDV